MEAMTSASSVLPSQPIIGLLLRLLHHYHAVAVSAALREAGFEDLSGAHVNVLPFLRPEGVNISDLARLTRVRKQTAAASVEHLERAGYVERRPDPHDRRATLVFMTARGEAVRPVAVAAGRRVEDQWAQLIGRERVEDLRALLMQLLEKLAERPIRPAVAGMDDEEAG